jgi:Uma2 family endonuclease
MAANPAYQLLTADQFLTMNFGPNHKAELDDGIIRMMAGGTIAHARVQGNVFSYLRVHLRGSGCRPYGSDMALKTGVRGVRFPDVSVVCNHPQSDADVAFTEASVVFEILSASTAEYDQTVKLREYQALATLQTIVFLDPDAHTVRIVQRLGPSAWRDEYFGHAVDVALPALSLTIPAAEIFSND